jgi:hypothetical protein
MDTLETCAGFAVGPYNPDKCPCRELPRRLSYLPAKDEPDMGCHEDAEITEIVIVLAGAGENKMADAAAKLKAVGMEIDRTDEDNCIVEGEIETCKLDALRKLDCVNYVRTVMTYIADYPKGDPRDKDGPEDDDD